MPNKKGLKVISSIRSDTAIAKIPVVAVTDLVLPEETKKYFVVGAGEYLSKIIQLKKRAEIIQTCRRHDQEPR